MEDLWQHPAGAQHTLPERRAAVLARVSLGWALAVLVLLAGVGCSNAPPLGDEHAIATSRAGGQRSQEPRGYGQTRGARSSVGPERADEVDCTPSGRDPRKIGVVVIHAVHTFEPGSEFGRRPPGRSIDVLAGRLRQAGFQVSAPEMPWTVAHSYDRSLEAALNEIAAAVEQLKEHGADRVVIVGHSFGGGAVMAFGAGRGGIDGVAALAPGPDPGAPIEMERRADSVAKAEAMVAAGRGDTIGSFEDFNGPYQGIVHTTAAHYLSFFSPGSGLSLHRNLAAWPRGLPLLWIDGTDEAQSRRRVGMVRRNLPREPLTLYEVVPAWHTAVADFAADMVVTWIKCL